MTKEDFDSPKENIDRIKDGSEDSSKEDKKDNGNSNDKKKASSEVKNANAAGLGSMGRNDQSELNPDSNNSSSEKGISEY